MFGNRKKVVAELESELRIARGEIQFLKAHQADLIREIRDTFEQDIIGRLRVENKAQHAAYKKRGQQFAQLIQAANQVIPEFANRADTPDLDPVRAMIQLRGAVAAAVALEEELAAPSAADREASDENRRREHEIGRRVEWPADSGKSA